jgi:hypothetical protein
MAIETLFGPSIADVQELRRQQQEREIAGAGGQFGVFAPLYQASLRFGNQAVQGMNTLLGAQDPMLKKATDIQGILTQYQGQDLTDPVVLKKISSDLAGKGYAKESFTIAQDAARYTQQAKAETRAERALVVTEESAKDAKYKNNPELLLRDALALPEEDPTRTALLTRYSDIVKDKNYSTAKQEADLAKAKADLARTQAETTRIQALAAKEGEIGVLGKPGPIGKLGGYRDVNGQIYAPTEIAKQRAAFEALGTMLDKTNNITAQDIKNAESIFDYTQETGMIKGAAAKVSEKTVDAQTRLAAVQLLQQIDSLPPGSASDADMKAAKAAFPGYGSSRNLLRWINDTKTTLSKNYNDQADKFGFTKKVKTTPLLSFDKEKGTAQDEWAVIGVQK